MFRQVIAAGELLLADDALVRFHSRVGAAVSGELVGPRKPARNKTRSEQMNKEFFFLMFSLLPRIMNTLISSALLSCLHINHSALL